MAAMPATTTTTTPLTPPSKTISPSMLGAGADVVLHSPVRVCAASSLGNALPAREGRHHQRYSAGGTRLVAGCVPYHRDAATGLVQVLLISNRGRSQWIIPKGGWEKDETEAEAAARESYEEAGVRGAIGPRLAVYNHTGKHGHTQHHAYYALDVQEVLVDWPDAGRRRRMWVPLDDACVMCTRKGMYDAIVRLRQLFASQGAAPGLGGGVGAAPALDPVTLANFSPAVFSDESTPDDSLAGGVVGGAVSASHKLVSSGEGEDEAESGAPEDDEEDEGDDLGDELDTEEVDDVNLMVNGGSSNSSATLHNGGGGGTTVPAARLGLRTARRRHQYELQPRRSETDDDAQAIHTTATHHHPPPPPPQLRSAGRRHAGGNIDSGRPRSGDATTIAQGVAPPLDKAEGRSGDGNGGNGNSSCRTRLFVRSTSDTDRCYGDDEDSP